MNVRELLGPPTEAQQIPRSQLLTEEGQTYFNSADASNSGRGKLRDIRIGAELDVSLQGESLGQKVNLNGVTVSRTRNMGVFQTKLSIPIKNSGVKIPISFTYATRPEPVKEYDVRGNIGITFDLDTLFSKSN